MLCQKSGLTPTSQLQSGAPWLRDRIDWGARCYAHPGRLELRHAAQQHINRAWHDGFPGRGRAGSLLAASPARGTDQSN